MTRSSTRPERYLAKVDRRGDDDCWPWLAGHNEHGYGTFRGDGNDQLAHRYGYKLQVGPIPAGWLVCHTCDNPPCQNPKHWFLGTHADNMADMTRKGRKRRKRHARVIPLKESAPQRKITDVQVRELREQYHSGQATQRELATQYGLTQAAVGAIARGAKRLDAGGPLSPNNRNRAGGHGLRNRNARLSPEQIAEIRSGYQRGEISQASLAVRYGVSQVTISRVVRGETGNPITRS